MGVIIGSNMIVFASVFSAVVLMCQAVSPLSPEELRQIRDFTAKAHMKRLQNFPDQMMTASTHYLGRRLPNVEKQPTIFMQAPTNNNAAVVKPTPYQLEPQQAGAVQNYLINYPITTSTVSQNQQGQIFQPRPPTAQEQQQHLQQQLQFIPPVQNAGQFNGPQRGPPHYKRPSFFSFGGPESSPPTSLLQFFFPKRPARRPSFRPPIRFQYAQSSHNPAILQHQQNLHNIMTQQHLLAVQQQQQQQHQQIQAAQQANVQPSSSPLSVQSSTVKVGAQVNPTAAAPSPVAPSANPNSVVASSSPFPNAQQQQQQLLHQNQQHFIPARPHHHHNAPFLNLNQFHREVPFFGKPSGKHGPPQKFPPAGHSYVPQNRPGDEVNYIQKFVSPQADFSFLNFGPPGPPVIAGPTSNRFSSPISFSHIEQMPFGLPQPQQLPMHMVVQSQEFPHYQFTTSFTASNSDGAAAPPPSPSSVPTSVQHNTNHIGEISMKPQEVQVHGQGQQSSSFQTQTIRHTQRVKKIRPRPTTTLPTTTPLPSTTQSLGDIIFESAKETREFHDSAHLVAPTISNPEPIVNVKPRKPKQHKSHHHQQQQQQHQQHHQLVEDHAGSLQKASVESSSVVFAPLIYTGESNEPLSTTTTTSTSSPRPITSTLVSVSTISTTTQEPFKPKIVKSKGIGEFHKSKSINNNHNNNNHNNNQHHTAVIHYPQHHQQHHYEKRVTASGSGLGAVTVEPLRITSTGSSAATSPSSTSKITLNPQGGRVVTTSVTSRVVSIGPQNPQKRYRLRKVKVPNPEAIKANNNKTSTTSSSSFSSSSSSSTSNIPSSTTPISTRIPRSTSTTATSSSSTTESSLTSSTTV